MIVFVRLLNPETHEELAKHYTDPKVPWNKEKAA